MKEMTVKQYTLTRALPSSGTLPFIWMLFVILKPSQMATMYAKNHTALPDINAASKFHISISDILKPRFIGCY
jgi:hypothetical protein